MKLEQELLFNQFAQGLLEDSELVLQFESLNIENKRKILREIENLITQSKCIFDDIKEAIVKSKLKPTFTPCIMIQRGLNHGNFQKIINLPENELTKVFNLFIYLFREGYNRRYFIEKG
jgi:hypothetical protein